MTNQSGYLVCVSTIYGHTRLRCGKSPFLHPHRVLRDSLGHVSTSLLAMWNGWPPDVASGRIRGPMGHKHRLCCASSGLARPGMEVLRPSSLGCTKHRVRTGGPAREEHESDSYGEFGWDRTHEGPNRIIALKWVGTEGTI